MSTENLKGSKTGVFIGQMSDESASVLNEDGAVTGFEPIGTHRAMMANRLSFFFDLKGEKQTDVAVLLEG